MIHEAIQEGVDEGFIVACAKACDGRDDPEERCPMQPCDGCACLYAEWIGLSWWRRMWREKPKKPSRTATVAALAQNAVTGALS